MQENAHAVNCSWMREGARSGTRQGVVRQGISHRRAKSHRLWYTVLCHGKYWIGDDVAKTDSAERRPRCKQRSRAQRRRATLGSSLHAGETDPLHRIGSPPRPTSKRQNRRGASVLETRVSDLAMHAHCCYACVTAVRQRPRAARLYSASPPQPVPSSVMMTASAGAPALSRAGALPLIEDWTPRVLCAGKPCSPTCWQQGRYARRPSLPPCCCFHRRL